MQMGLSKDHSIANKLALVSLFNYNIEDDLKKIHVPTLLIGGEFDCYIDPDKIGTNRQPKFRGRIVTEKKGIEKGTFPTTFGLIASSAKEIYIIPGATHTLSFTHPYNVCWLSAYFLHRFCRGRVDYGTLKNIMRLARKKS